MIFDSLEKADHYTPLHPLFKQAFDFLRDPAVRALGTGRVELDAGGRIWANVQSYRTQPLEEGRYETHRKYIDIQCLLSGEEAIVYTPSEAALRVVVPYSDTQDIAFQAAAPGTPVRLQPGVFALLFPGEPHMPGRSLCADAPCEVRKVVVKIAAERGGAWDIKR